MRRIKDDTYVSSLGDHTDVGDIAPRIRNQKKEEQEYLEGDRNKLWRERNNFGFGRNRCVVLGAIYTDRFSRKVRFESERNQTVHTHCYCYGTTGLLEDIYFGLRIFSTLSGSSVEYTYIT